ncbi:MAG: hypothetical protein ACOX6Q_00375 [Candidatus Dojkabacteria bacterium]|jgi:hypothetical protein
MTDESQDVKYISLRERFSSSSITRVFLFILLLGIYSWSISPKVESFLTEKISDLYKEYSFTEINVLTPVYDVYAYTGSYNLATDNSNEEFISRNKFFTMDSRILAMNKFLKDYHSPMAKYAKTFVEEADKYGLDWRLLASISGVESAFGNIIPANSNNAWGWRGINGNEAGWSMFSSWNHAISHITERIAVGYGTNLSPFDMESTYCPPCGLNPEHAWANGVNNYMNQLSYYLNNLSDF